MKSSLRKLRGLAALHKHGHGGDHKDRRDLLSLAQLDELAKAYRVLLSLSLSLSLSTVCLAAEKSTEIDKLSHSFWTCQTFVNRFVSFLFFFDFSPTRHDLKITSFYLYIIYILCLSIATFICCWIPSLIWSHQSVRIQQQQQQQQQSNVRGSINIEEWSVRFMYTLAVIN